jgi:hypothetical protein
MGARARKRNDNFSRFSAVNCLELPHQPEASARKSRVGQSQAANTHNFIVKDVPRRPDDFDVAQCQAGAAHV